MKTKKSNALIELEALALEANRVKYPTLPEGARYIGKYVERTANGLQKCIIDFLKFNGWQCERISVTGRYVDNSKVVTDVLGNKKKIGSGQYIPSSMQRGSADLSATIKGRSVKIEVKIGKDVQSQHQKNYQLQVERAGGVYLIAKDFQSFFDWYKNFLANSTT